MCIIIAGILLWILAVIYTILGNIAGENKPIELAQKIGGVAVVVIIIGLISLVM